MTPIEIKDCEKDEWKIIVEGLTAFNREKVPKAEEIPYEFPQYKAVVNGILAGGILGRRESYGVLHIEVLYLHPEYRQQGLGTMLLQRMHHYAREKKCSLIRLSTYDFQARGFYEKHGYSLFGQLENCPEGHTKYFMKLDLPKN
jgi:GNAT superfamily N-acetyltransferase